MENISRRDAIVLSGSTLAGLSLGAFAVEHLAGQAAPAQQAQEWPTTLVPRPRREGFPVDLPLNADGSAIEHKESEAGEIEQGANPMWRTQDKKPPAIEYDYKKMAIKVDTRGLAKLAGTMHFSDLDKLPKVSHTFLLQCGAANPKGIVKWTGVRFSDFADMLGVVKGTHYVRFVASDKFYVDEDIDTLRHPQVMLAWMMNDKPLTPDHGAPLRLVIPFRYGNRSIKGIQEITFATPGLPTAPLPG